MPTPTVFSLRLLPDGTPLQNRLLVALPAAAYARLQRHLHMHTTVTGRTLQEHGARLTDVYFPNGGVFSVTNKMRDGALVEVATVGREGMLGIGVFLGDRSGAGRTFQQVPDGPFPSMSVGRFIKESATAGPFRDGGASELVVEPAGPSPLLANWPAAYAGTRWHRQVPPQSFGNTRR